MRTRLLVVASVIALALLAYFRPSARAAKETEHGMQLARSGDTAGAEKVLAHALSLDGSNVKALYNDGIALARLGRPNDAAERFEAFVKLRPDDALGWFHLARAELQKGKPDDSLRALQRSVEAGFQDYTLLTGDGFFRQLYPDVRFLSLEVLVAKRAGVEPNSGVLAGLGPTHDGYGGHPLDTRVRIPGLHLATECANPKANSESCGAP